MMHGRKNIKIHTNVIAGPSGRAVLGVSLWPLACWDCGFESLERHGFLSCECCTLSGRCLCDGADHSPRGVLPTVVRRCVWCRNLMNEEVLAHWGAVLPKKKPNKRKHKLDISWKIGPNTKGSTETRLVLVKAMLSLCMPQSIRQVEAYLHFS